MFRRFLNKRVQIVSVALASVLLVPSCGGDGGPAAPVGGGPTTPTGWLWQNPVPQGSGLVAVHVVNATTAVAIGPVGTIVRTTDGGVTWVNQDSGTEDWLEAVWFTDALTGTVLTYNGILRTTDWGNTWSAQDSGVNTHLKAVFFVDATTGCIVGNRPNSGAGTILRTTDGGVTWIAQANGARHQLEGVYFTSALEGTVVGTGGTILHTTTGGVK